jgi:HPt (histidine-containing phosphotransfer) domain-containing protein
VENVPIVDWARLKDVTRGDSSLADEFLTGLVEEATLLLDRVERAIAIGDAAAIDGLAHTLKGMASEVGALRLRAIAIALGAAGEPVLRRRELEAARESLAEIAALPPHR